MSSPVGARRAVVASLSAALVWAASVAAAAELSGRVELRQRGGKPTAAEDLRQVVVWYAPQGGRAPAVESSERQLVTRGKRFEPRVLVVPRGTTVRFPNRDPILHNVFSISPGNAFDLGLAGEGPGGTVTFDQPGVVRIFCNVHHTMYAYVVVVDTPFVTSPGSDGTFRLRGVPAGAGRLHAWHERSELQEVDVTVPAAAPVVVELEVSKPRVPPHLNKLGRRYGELRDRYER